MKAEELFNPEKMLNDLVRDLSFYDNRKMEDVQLGKDFIKFKETATGKVFIIMAMEERPGTKTIVSVRNKEKKLKIARPNYQKPI